MTDNIRPDHYRTGEIDLYEAFSQIFPHNEYRAGMQMIAMRYMFRDKIDRVEDLGKGIYTLERLKEKEIEHREKQEKEKNHKTLEEAFASMSGVSFDFDVSEAIHRQSNQERISLLEHLTYSGFEYIAKDINDELWAYEERPKKYDVQWAVSGGDTFKVRGGNNYPEVQWSDEEPTKISDLLATYENGGENGKYGGVDEN